jgi:hypothetical protein
LLVDSWGRSPDVAKSDAAPFGEPFSTRQPFAD